MQKKIILYTFLFLSGIGILKAQNFIKYDRFYLNDFEYNPSLAGLKNETVGFISTKKNWLGIENSPSTQNLFIHTNAKLLGLYNPKKFISSGAQKVGLGLSLYNDKNGPLSTIKIQFSYAYHILINNSMKLSLGLSTQLSQHSLNEGMLMPRDANDPLITQQNESSVTPSFNLGLYLSNTKFHFGLSVMNLANFSSFTNGYKYYKNISTYYLSAGYKIKINRDLDFEPNILFYSDSYIKFKLNSTFKLYYKDSFWLGLGYTMPESFIIYAAVKFKVFDLGYSFDYSSSPIFSNSKGNHMGFIGFHF